MISFFKKVSVQDVVPPKSYTTAVVVVYAILFLLYTSAAILYSHIVFKCQHPAEQKFLLAVSIIEIAITGFSIVISVIATKISNHYTNTCLEKIEHFKRQNTPLFTSNELIFRGETAKKYTKIALKIKHLVIVPFSAYLCIMVANYIFIESSVVQLLTVMLGSTSTVFSVILAWASSASCVIMGRYTNLLLDALYDENKRLFDSYNNLLITQSHSTEFNH